MAWIPRAAVAMGIAMLATVALSLPAAAAKVAPHQFFTGVINGRDGNTSIPIVIGMACFGPLHPGQTGHPLGGQTLAVHRLFPPTTAADSPGNTGDGSTIDVFFNAPPPASFSRMADATSFTHYDKPRTLPTSLTLPCAGTGTVWFVPVPVVPPSRASAVPVQFVSQP